MSDVTFVCDDCNGFGVYTSGRVCGGCKGHGARLCMDCHERPATQVEDDYYSCADCAVLASACAFCLSGTPTTFRDGEPCCEKCGDSFGEIARGSDTVPCAAPDFEEVA